MVTNVHFPPGMKAANRRLSILRSAAFQARHPGGVKFVAGDMNSDLADDSGAWLRKACTDSRYWVGFTHLYPGEATNIVANRAGVSRRELDWVLVSAQSPVHACEKFLLPGLSTHLAVACDLSVRSEYLSQANPAGRLFSFRRAEPSHLASAAVMASLAFWWAWWARLSPDGAFTWYWECISGIIPSSSSGFRLAAEAAAKLFEGTQLAAQDRLTAWWADRQDAAFLRAVQLTEGKLQGTGVTSITRQLGSPAAPQWSAPGETPMPLPGVRARQRRSDPASVESGGPAVWAPNSGRGGAAPGQQRLTKERCRRYSAAGRCVVRSSSFWWRSVLRLLR